MSYGTCKICRCTDYNACVHPDEGSCYWVDDTHELCSACLDHKITPVIDAMRVKENAHKWIFTSIIGKRVGNKKTLPLLRKMEELGFVKSKKSAKWIEWSLPSNGLHLSHMVIDEAINLESMKSLQAIAEALANDIIALNHSDTSIRMNVVLPDEILCRVKDLIDKSYNLRFDPRLNRFKVLKNFLEICYTKGMNINNPFHIYTLSMNNCYFLAGTEPGGANDE